MYLEECPFDSAHGKDSAIIQLDSGALVFHCFHSGCSCNGWKEFRELYEPYEEREFKKEYKKEYQKKPEVNLTPKVPEKLDEKNTINIEQSKAS